MIGRSLVLLSLAMPAMAGDFSLQLPISCDLQTDCHIQQYVDHDPGPDARDFTCSPLSYDGHKGTDFAVPTLARMQTGVPVLAAASGTVRSLRDGMPDRGFDQTIAAEIKGRECGNGVVIDHADGWQTQYCHLRQGSIAVENGQKVLAGTQLGLVGMSGRAQFPHVHLSVRRHGSVVDPFDPSGVISCDNPEPNTLWQAPPPRRPGGIMSLGITDDVPSFEAIKAGTAASPALTRDAKALVVFGQFFGTRTGDSVRLVLSGPGEDVVSEEIRLKKNQAQSFRAVGKKRRTDPWPGGIYTAQVQLLRNGAVLETRTTTVTVK